MRRHPDKQLIQIVARDEQIAMFSDDGRFQPKALAVTKEAVKQLGELGKLPPDDQLYTEAFLPGAQPAQ